MTVVLSHLRANSVTWNPHKMMSVPLQCSALLVREEVGRVPFKSSSHTGNIFVFLCQLQTFWIWFHRVWCRTATRCTPATCSSRTNTTTFPTTPETKRCSVDATWTSSSCGSCGELRWGRAIQLTWKLALWLIVCMQLFKAQADFVTIDILDSKSQETMWNQIFIFSSRILNI